MKKLNFVSTAFLVPAFLLAACNGGGGMSNGSISGSNLNLVVTDDPFPYDFVSAANINVSKVEMRNADSGGFIVVSTDSNNFNLSQLRNGITSSFPAMSIPAGQYDQIRLTIASSSIDLTDGRHFDLTVPSGSTSGLKISVSPPINVVTGLSTDLLLDFDLSNSYTALGSANSASGITGFNFHPHLRCTNLTTAGTIEGVIQGNTLAAPSVESPLKGALVTLSAPDSSGNPVTVSSAVTDSNGHYKIIGLLPKLYTVTVSATGYASASDTALVIAGNSLTESLSLSAQ